MEIQASAGASMLAQSLKNESFDEQVVSKTMDYINSEANRSGSGKTDANDDFQTSVLSAGLTDKGNAINKLI
ncbi:MAG: hypothetical protein ACLFSY_04595 [Desulfonatronovibrionaceae bacterium]